MLHPSSHPDSELINHAAHNGLTISLPRYMTKQERQSALHYGTRDSVNKEVDFIHTELSNQFQVGHVAIFCWLPSQTFQTCGSTQYLSYRK